MAEGRSFNAGSIIIMSRCSPPPPSRTLPGERRNVNPRLQTCFVPALFNTPLFVSCDRHSLNSFFQRQYLISLEIPFEAPRFLRTSPTTTILPHSRFSGAVTFFYLLLSLPTLPSPFYLELKHHFHTTNRTFWA